MDESKKALTITASRGEYKGYPMLKLSSGENEKYPFQFGLQKAKRILACIPDIQEFVRDCEAKAAKAATEANKVVVK